MVLHYGGLTVDLIYNNYNITFCIFFKLVIMMPTHVEDLQYLGALLNSL